MKKCVSYIAIGITTGAANIKSNLIKARHIENINILAGNVNIYDAVWLTIKIEIDPNYACLCLAFLQYTSATYRQGDYWLLHRSLITFVDDHHTNTNPLTITDNEVHYRPTDQNT